MITGSITEYQDLLNMRVHELFKLIFTDNAAKGFDAPTKDPGKSLMLVMTELAEAYEEHRSGYANCEVRIVNGKPEGVPVEIADAIIRLAHYLYDCGDNGEFRLLEGTTLRRHIKLDEVIAMKLAYNRTRPFKHGKRF